jgi:hypothetical protein
MFAPLLDELYAFAQLSKKWCKAADVNRSEFSSD